MRKLLLSLFTLLSLCGFAQQDNLIPPTGNVGIGTLNPSAKLDVNGRMIVDSTLVVKDSVRIEKDLRIEQDLKVDGKVVMLQNSVAREDFKIQGDLKLPNATALGNNQLNSGGFSHLVLKPNGTARIISDLDYTNRLINLIYAPPLPTDPLSLCDLAGYTDNPVWHNGPQKLFSECPDVFVGIGTDAPLHSLDVRGRGYFNATMGIGIEPQAETQVMAKTTYGTGFCIDHNYAGDYGYAYKAIVNNDLSKGIGIYNNAYSKDVFTVYGSGKIEVSNSTGEILQLDADGLLHARKIRVDEEIWPDYVFKSDYNLLPLIEVDKYIQANGHLPKVPSEESILQNGVDLGEMNRLLLEKVEELTLYTIEQEKKLVDLQQQINDIRNAQQ